MIKEEIIKQFDALTKELFGDYGFSEYIMPSGIDQKILYDKTRIGFTKLDSKRFKEYIEHYVECEKLDISIQETLEAKGDDTVAVTKLYINFFDMMDGYNTKEIMITYILKKVLEYFPDAVYCWVDSDEDCYFYVFRLDI